MIYRLQRIRKEVETFEVEAKTLVEAKRRLAKAIKDDEAANAGPDRYVRPKSCVWVEFVDRFWFGQKIQEE